MSGSHFSKVQTQLEFIVTVYACQTNLRSVLFVKKMSLNGQFVFAEFANPLNKDSPAKGFIFRLFCIILHKLSL